MAASHLTCLKDHPRKGEKLTLSPSGTLAAITDSLGRILLLDTQALVVLRLWKVPPVPASLTGRFEDLPAFSPYRIKLKFPNLQGYRDACCLFMEASVGRDEGPSSSSWRDETKRDHCLCLAIHAPKKGIIEVLMLHSNSSSSTVFGRSRLE